MKFRDPLYEADMSDPKARARRERGYWRTAGGDNAPGEYAVASPTRAAFLLGLVRALEPRPFSVLEVGCNVGRNLEILRREGIPHLAGIDVRDCSVEMEEHFPELAASALFWWRPAAVALKYLNEDVFDVVFSLAALMHMAEDSIMVEMSRVARNHVITIEIEDRGWPLFYPRDYRAVFEGLGFRQIYEQVAMDEPLNKYIARLFERVA